MATVYVDPVCVKDSIDFFISQEYTSPEQIGLFFLFKANKFNSREYQTYDATGAQKARLTRYLYDLCALFDAKQENGGKYVSLFPFSMDRTIKKTTYYNGGTEFKQVIGRVKDTMDNTLIDDGKYLRKDDLDGSKYKFAPNYVDMLYSDFLKGHRISLQKLAAWYFRFYAFDVDDEWVENLTADNFETFTRICTKKLIEDLNITADELSTMFDTTDGIIKYSQTGITGEEIRSKFAYETNATPEVSPLTAPVSYMLSDVSITREEVTNLAAPHGDNITEEELSELLLDTKQVVLSGPPGTGKSYISDKVKVGFDHSYLIQFHPNLTYEQFIGGSTFDENGVVHPKAGVFLEFCHEAGKAENANQKYLFMIDEINRGNVSKIFGETILALDREYTVQLPTALTAKDGTTVTEFRIPENVYILATMNSADRSIALVDYAIRRRFAFVDFYPNSEVVDFESDYSQLDDIKVGKVMDGINEKLYSVLGDADLLLGQSYFLPKWARDEVSGKIKWTPQILKRLFNYYVIPIIEEYTYGNKRYLQNILGDKLVGRISDEEEFIEELKAQLLK